LRFERGDRVVDPHDPLKTAVIVEGPELVGTAFFYEVLLANQETFLFREDQLTKRSIDRSNPVSWLVDRPLVDPARFARFLTQLRLSTGLTDVFYSFSSTRTLFRVHQFKPVIKAVESSMPRLLLADEVGLGKTIEAGLVWAELDARTPTRRVLVVCPSSLRQKWELEMIRRFDREMRQVNRAEFLSFVDQYYERGDTVRFFGISTFPQLRDDSVLEVLSQQPPTFDLVIIDEAHVMRNTATRTHQLGDLLAQNTTALLLLSATPVNLGSNDLFTLLSLLRPDEFDSPAVFDALVEPNEHINRAARLLRSEFPPPSEKILSELRQVEHTSLRNRFLDDPEYQNVVAQLVARPPTTRTEVADLQGALTNLNTLSHVYTRTRKRDLKDHTAIRRAVTMEVILSDEEQAVYESVVRYVNRLKRRRPGAAPALSAVMPARQAASCLPVMRRYLERLLEQRRLESGVFEGAEDDEDELAGVSVQEVLLAQEDADLIRELEDVCTGAEGYDSKFEALTEQLLDFRGGGTEKFLIFSFFRLTLDYLEGRLADLGLVCQQLTGSTPMRERDAVIDDFRNGDTNVLLCSEVGSEGLDFEFCDVLINYDVPWNPMRLEQRIGRIDRFGQQSPAVRILNFSMPDTIDTEIFLRLYRRIGIFEHSIGELEPILGEHFSELTKAIATPELTLQEQQRVAEQIALAVEREQHELDEFETLRTRLIGADDYVEDALEDAVAAHRYLTPAELRRYVSGFLHDEARPARLNELEPGSDGMQVLLGSAALAEHMRNSVRDLAAPRLLELVANLETGNAVSVTFDPDAAFRHRAEFLNLRHPIVQAITHFYAGTAGRLHPAGYVRIPGKAAAQRWIFFVFLLSASGIQPRRSLFAVGYEPATGRISEDVGQDVLTFLTSEGPQVMEERDIPVIDPDVVNAAYDAVLASADAARSRLEQELRDRNTAAIAARTASLRQGLEAKRAQLEELAGRQELDERIRRMRRAQIANLDQRTSAEIAALDGQTEVVVGMQVKAGGLADFEASEQTASLS
jgi:superfamily II DNA or RNA helicase